MTITQLQPILTNQKSFYNKANVNTTKYTKDLISYETKMATIKNGKLIYLNKNINNYTQTTLKHLKDFLYQELNIKDLTKKDILKMMKDLNK